MLRLVAVAFFWLNLWGEDRLVRLGTALLNHPWRLPKRVIDLFDWMAQQIHYLLHPRPKLEVADT